jgi:hypothetical protein
MNARSQPAAIAAKAKPFGRGSTDRADRHKEVVYLMIIPSLGQKLPLVVFMVRLLSKKVARSNAT